MAKSTNEWLDSSSFNSGNHPRQLLRPTFVLGWPMTVLPLWPAAYQLFWAEVRAPSVWLWHCPCQIPHRCTGRLLPICSSERVHRGHSVRLFSRSNSVSRLFSLAYNTERFFYVRSDISCVAHIYIDPNLHDQSLKNWTKTNATLVVVLKVSTLPYVCQNILYWTSWERHIWVNQHNRWNSLR